MILGKVFLGGVGGGNINGVKSGSAAAGVGAGTCACIDGDASECWLQLLERASECGRGGPSECVDGEVCVQCTGFCVKLDEHNTYGAHWLVEGFPGFAAVTAWCGCWEA